MESTFRANIEGSTEAPQRQFSLPFDNNAYLFVVSNEEDREKRKASLLHFSCALAKSFERQRNEGQHDVTVERIFAYTTEGRKLTGRSFDGLAVEYNDCLSMIEEAGVEPPEMFKYLDKGQIDEWSG